MQPQPQPDKLLSGSNPSEAMKKGLVRHHQAQDGNILKLLPTEAQSISMHTPLHFSSISDQDASVYEVHRAAIDKALEPSGIQMISIPEPTVEEELNSQDKATLHMMDSRIQNMIDNPFDPAVDIITGKPATGPTEYNIPEPIKPWSIEAEAMLQNEASLRSIQDGFAQKVAFNAFNSSLVGVPFKTTRSVLKLVDEDYAQKFDTMMGVDTTAETVGDMIGLWLGFGKFVKGAQWIGQGIGAAAKYVPNMYKQMQAARSLAQGSKVGRFAMERAPYAAASGMQLAAFRTFKNDMDEIDLNPKRIATDLAIGAAADMVLVGGFRGVGNFLGFYGSRMPLEGVGTAGIWGAGIGGTAGAYRGAFGDDKDMGFFGRLGHIGQETAYSAGGGFVKAAGARLMFNHLSPAGWPNIKNALEMIPTFGKRVLAPLSQAGSQVGTAITHEIERVGARFGLNQHQFNQMYRQASILKGQNPKIAVSKILVKNIDEAAQANEKAVGKVTAGEVAETLKNNAAALDKNINDTRLNLFSTTEGIQYNDISNFRKQVFRKIEKMNLDSKSKKAAKQSFDNFTTPEVKPPTLSKEDVSLFIQNAPEANKLILVLEKNKTKLKQSLDSQVASPSKVFQNLLKRNPHLSELERNTLQQFIRRSSDAASLVTSANKSFPGATYKDLIASLKARNGHFSLKTEEGFARTLDHLPKIFTKYRSKTPADAAPHINRFIDRMRLTDGQRNSLKHAVDNFVKRNWNNRILRARESAQTSKQPLFLKNIEDVQDKARKAFAAVDEYTPADQREGLKGLLSAVRSDRDVWIKSLKNEDFLRSMRELDQLTIERDVMQTALNTFDPIRNKIVSPLRVRVPYIWGSGSLSLNLISEALTFLAPTQTTAQQVFRRNISERFKDWVVRAPRPMAGNPMDNARMEPLLRESVIKEHVLKKWIQQKLAPGQPQTPTGTLLGVFDVDEKYILPIPEESY